MSRCHHPVEKIEKLNPDGDSGFVRFDDVLHIWGKCECGSKTIITATVEGVETDGEGMELVQE